MANAEELLSQAEENFELAQGYVSDAEFREEHETRVVRYLQAITRTMMAVYLQNAVLLEAMGEEGGYGAVSGR
ncbi:MAG: hypothetical protein PVJ27_08045 [Candidatus Brocadiaceae bacterium]